MNGYLTVTILFSLLMALCLLIGGTFTKNYTFHQIRLKSHDVPDLCGNRYSL
jgi:hypothetical protein